MNQWPAPDPSTIRDAPLFVVRVYDMFDGWVNCTGPIRKAEADAFWNERTNNGTERCSYNDGDYYWIFPADTRMLDTPERRGR